MEPALASVFVSPHDYRKVKLSFCTDESCSDLLATVMLERLPDFTFTMTPEEGGRAPNPVEKVDLAGVDLASLFRLPVPSDLRQVDSFVHTYGAATDLYVY